MARPSKLNKALIADIVEALSTGATIEDVCRHVGIVPATFYDWRTRASEGGIFAEFSDAVTHAQGVAKMAAITTLKVAMQPYDEVSHVVETITETRMRRNGEPYEYKRTLERDVVTHKQGDWRAAIEYLKRRHYTEWGDKSAITGADGGALNITFNGVITDDDT